MSECAGKNKKCVFLTISIVANLLLLGVIAGEFYERHRMMAPDDKRPELSATAKKAFHDVMGTKRKEIHGVIKDVKAKKEALYAVVVAEDFDEDAYDRVAKDFAQVACGASEHKLETFKEILVVLPLEDRQRIAKHFIDNVLLSKHKKKGPRGVPEKFDGEVPPPIEQAE